MVNLRSPGFFSEVDPAAQDDALIDQISHGVDAAEPADVPPVFVLIAGKEMDPRPIGRLPAETDVNVERRDRLRTGDAVVRDKRPCSGTRGRERLAEALPDSSHEGGEVK